MKQALIVVSFGSSSAETRALTLDAVTADMKAAFPDMHVIQAYTSEFIRKRLASEGIDIPNLPQCLEQLQAEGYDRIIVQPTHLTLGEEYESKIHPVVEAASETGTVIAGEPLLADPNRYPQVLETLLQVFHPEEGEHLVLVGHGSPHRHNAVYAALQERADRGALPIHIGVLENTDWPSFSDVEERLRMQQASRVCLAPLLIAGGMHIHREIAGEDNDSWKNRLQRMGLSVRTCLHGLGEYAPFRELYVDMVRSLSKR